MSLKSGLVIFIVSTVLISLTRSEEKFFVVSTTENPPDCHVLNNRFNEEFRDALKVLNDNITHYLQQIEQKIISETENKLKRMKQEIVDSVEAITVKTPRDCKEVQSKGYQDSGVYRIQPYLSNNEFSVYCDMTIRGGGWTYVLNRFDGSQDFYLNWEDYKKGFGNPPGEYWIGLDHLYYLTNSKSNELLIELIDWEATKVYAHYSKFKIGGESTGYKLVELGEYKGDAGDSFSGHLGYKFSTKDRDQDTNPGNCAQIYPGAWWFSSCFGAHLAGKYIKNSNPIPYASGVIWFQFRGHHYSLKEVRMMIRPLSTL